MDPLTQATIGATCAGVFSKKENLRRALVVGALAGMAADLDILIRSAEDSLLSLEYHRHFTHALIFIPLGALICSFILSLVMRVPWKSLYFPALCGYATAGPLDALTSYGTHLLWPFSDERTAFNLIAIIDPLYTLPLLFLLGLAYWERNPRIFYASILFIAFWHSLGSIQKRKATDLLIEVAQENNLKPERLWVQPSIGNLLVWRGIIETKDDFYVAGLRVLFKEKKYTSGGKLKKFKLEESPLKNVEEHLKKDVQRFSQFSSGFVAQMPGENLLTDVRYSLLPWTLAPLWALDISTENSPKHFQVKYFRDRDNLPWNEFWLALKGEGVFSETEEDLKKYY